MVCRKPLDPQWTPATREREKLLQHHSTDQPEAHEYSSEMRRLADGYGDRVLIGEIFLPNDRHERWYGTPERPQVHPPFNFQLIECAWDAAELRQVIGDYEGSLPAFGWPNWVLGSHDAPRISARIGEAQARIAAMLLLTFARHTYALSSILALAQMAHKVDGAREDEIIQRATTAVEPG